MEYFVGFIISYWLLVELAGPWAERKLWEIRLEEELERIRSNRGGE